MGTLREARSGAPVGVPTYVGSVSRGAWRRWSIVASGTALLCAIPAVIAALPVPASSISAPALRARILASAGVPYEGYAESTVNLGLPQLPDLHNVSTLLDGTTDQYVWYRSPAYWRADDVTAAGESDTYGDGGVPSLWTSGSTLLTQVTGAEPVRLPRAPDLLPPALARRLLDTAGHADRISRLPDRRSAGAEAAGLGAGPGRDRPPDRGGEKLGRSRQRAPRRGPDLRPRHRRSGRPARADQHVPRAEPDPAQPGRGDPAPGPGYRAHHHPAARRGRRAER